MCRCRVVVVVDELGWRSWIINSVSCTIPAYQVKLKLKGITTSCWWRLYIDLYSPGYHQDFILSYFCLRSEATQFLDEIVSYYTHKTWWYGSTHLSNIVDPTGCFWTSSGISHVIRELSPLPLCIACLRFHMAKIMHVIVRSFTASESCVAYAMAHCVYIITRWVRKAGWRSTAAGLVVVILLYSRSC